MLEVRLDQSAGNRRANAVAAHADLLGLREPDLPAVLVDAVIDDVVVTEALRPEQLDLAAFVSLADQLAERQSAEPAD